MSSCASSWSRSWSPAGWRPADIPEAWDAKMRDYLGLSTIDNPADGPMQDVHWPGGAFGYFPSYTLGAMMAAQQWAALTREHPSVEDDIARGQFRRVNDWRRENIWSQALALVDAGPAGARHRRKAQRGAFHRASEAPLWRLMVGRQLKRLGRLRRLSARRLAPERRLAVGELQLRQPGIDAAPGDQAGGCLPRRCGPLPSPGCGRPSAPWPAGGR